MYANAELGGSDLESITLLGLCVGATAGTAALKVGAIATFGLDACQRGTVLVRAVAMFLVTEPADHDPPVTPGTIEHPVAVGLG